MSTPVLNQTITNGAELTLVWRGAPVWEAKVNESGIRSSPSVLTENDHVTPPIVTSSEVVSERY